MESAEQTLMLALVSVITTLSALTYGSVSSYRSQMLLYRLLAHGKEVRILGIMMENCATADYVLI
jgi:hypothetical protein